MSGSGTLFQGGPQSASTRWPEDPASGGLLGGAIGCAAGWLAGVIANTKARGNDPAWGCLIGGFIGAVLGSGGRTPA